MDRRWRYPNDRSPNLILIPRPRIEREIDDHGWYVIKGEQGWLCGSRRDALREFDDLVKFDRTGTY
jgi:hypothetical protein